MVEPGLADVCLEPGRSRPLTATCSRGLEGVLGDELRALGAGRIEAGAGVVRFAGDLRLLYLANLQLRTAMRVLLPVAEGPVRDRRGLYQLAGRVAWEQLLQSSQTIAVEAVGRTMSLRSTVFAAQVVKDAVVDRLRRHWGCRPDVDRRDADLRIHLHLGEDQVTISLDSSGEPLSHRGYRPRGGPAPLSEVLAAGILLLAGYDGFQPLLDPMCGTGTIAIEAAFIATRRAPGLRRSFACERWCQHQPGLLKELRSSAEASVQPAPAAITACDLEGRSVTATLRNLAAAGIDQDQVSVLRRDLADTPVLSAGSMIISNPPYGQRIGDVDELRPLYRGIGDMLKQRAAGSRAWLLVGERVLAAEIHLRPSRRIVLFNGPIECRLMRFDLYEGSKEGRADNSEAR